MSLITHAWVYSWLWGFAPRLGESEKPPSDFQNILTAVIKQVYFIILNLTLNRPLWLWWADWGASDDKNRKWELCRLFNYKVLWHVAPLKCCCDDMMWRVSLENVIQLISLLVTLNDCDCGWTQVSFYKCFLRCLFMISWQHRTPKWWWWLKNKRWERHILSYLLYFSSLHLWRISRLLWWTGWWRKLKLSTVLTTAQGTAASLPLENHSK